MLAEAVDYFFVAPHHIGIDQRCQNWARYVQVHRPGWVGPIWKLGRSHGRQWHQPEVKDPIDTADGAKIERAVAGLPAPERHVLRWAYVRRYGELKCRRELGGGDPIEPELLFRLLEDGRDQLLLLRV